MRRLALIVGMLSACATTAPPREPVPQVRVPPELDVPGFQLHTLENGMRLVTIENHAHPIVGLTGYVTTGGRTESAHFAGALHYIEHLVFKGGTRRFPPTAFRKRIAALGDENGGWTWDDEIQFGFEVPKANFEEALDVFAESLLELQWSHRWFEDERKVVLQEIEKVGERPWHKLWNAWDELAFTRHPYRRAVIGSAQTVRGLSMEELERYYEERFTPNHLILIVVGDFDESDMVDLVKRRFGRYRPGPESFELDDVAEPEQREARSREMALESISNARFLVGVRTPGAAHPDTPALMVLAELLGSPTTGIPAALTRKKQWVTAVDAEYAFMVDYGQLIVQGEADPARVRSALEWVQSTLGALGKRTFDAAAVGEAARGLLTRRARSWETFGEQAQHVGFWVERMGPRAAREATARILAQTPESVARVAEKYLRPERLVTILAGPKGVELAPATSVADPDPAPPIPDLAKRGLLRSRGATPWTYRETGSAAGVVRFEYDSGLTLLVHPSASNGLLWLVGHVAGGQWVEPAEKAGLGVLVSRLVTAGTGNLSVSEWDRMLASAAISRTSELSLGDRANLPRNVHARDGSTLALGGTTDQLEVLLALAGEALFRPKFPADEVDKAKRILLAEIQSLPEDNLEFIKQEFYRLAFPKHPYGRPTLGDRATLEPLGQTDVVDFHRATWTPDRITLALFGRVDPARAAALIAERWADVIGKAGPLPAPLPPVPRAQAKRARTLRRGRDQWCVNIGFPTVDAADASFADLEVLLAIARGRHFYKYVYELGTSYRSWIKLWPQRSPSLWLLENDVARDGFDDTLVKMRDDLRFYGHGVFGPEDLRLARTRLLNRTVLDAQSGLRVAFELARAPALSLPWDRHERRRRALKAVTLEGVNAMAKRVFGSGDRYQLITK